MMQESATIIDIRHIQVGYGQKTVIGDVTLTAGHGELIGILGPNGSGKSTLLKSLCGLLPYSKGEVLLFGRSLLSMSERDRARQVAYMQQEVQVSFGITALDAVLTGRYPYLHWWQNESPADYAIARQYMSFAGVGDLAQRPLHELSGGERQRVMLAKALAQETPLLFLDEPTASLDLSYQEEIFRYCQQICREGKTVLIVVHDIRLAVKFCSRLILLSAGGILADGLPSQVVTPEHLYQAFGLQSAVYENYISGQLDIHTYDRGSAGQPGKAIHVIGGGSTVGTIIRALRENAYPVSCGILRQGDMDTAVAMAFGTDNLVSQAFGPIGRELGEQNRQKIAQAHYTILGNLYFSQENLDNLKAAFTAGRLIIVEDSPIDSRDGTAGEAALLYRQLTARPETTVMKLDELLLAVEKRSL